MNNKLAANIVFAIAAVIGVGSLSVDTTQLVDSDTFFPDTVKVGELAVFNVQGTDCIWQILPATPLVVHGDGNEFMATSFPSEGTYNVTVFYSANGTLTVRSTTVNVTNSPAPSPDVPVEVFPEVVPQPEPEPRPEPVPDDYSNTSFPQAAETVKNICESNKVDKQKAAVIADNFLAVSGKIDSGELKTVAAVISETAVSNRKSLIGDVAAVAEIQLLISRQRFDGNLKSVEQFSDLWRQISRGLNEYSQE